MSARHSFLEHSFEQPSSTDQEFKTKSILFHSNLDLDSEQSNGKSKIIGNFTMLDCRIDSVNLTCYGQGIHEPISWTGRGPGGRSAGDHECPLWTSELNFDEFSKNDFEKLKMIFLKPQFLSDMSFE